MYSQHEATGAVRRWPAADLLTYKTNAVELARLNSAHGLGLSRRLLEPVWVYRRRVRIALATKLRLDSTGS